MENGKEMISDAYEAYILTAREKIEQDRALGYDLPKPRTYRINHMIARGVMLPIVDVEVNSDLL